MQGWKQTSQSLTPPDQTSPSLKTSPSPPALIPPPTSSESHPTLSFDQSAAVEKRTSPRRIVQKRIVPTSDIIRARRRERQDHIAATEAPTQKRQSRGDARTRLFRNRRVDRSGAESPRDSRPRSHLTDRETPTDAALTDSPRRRKLSRTDKSTETSSTEASAQDTSNSDDILHLTDLPFDLLDVYPPRPAPASDPLPASPDELDDVNRSESREERSVLKRSQAERRQRLQEEATVRRLKKKAIEDRKLADIRFSRNIFDRPEDHVTEEVKHLEASSPPAFTPEQRKQRKADALAEELSKLIVTGRRQRLDGK